MGDTRVPILRPTDFFDGQFYLDPISKKIMLRADPALPPAGSGDPPLVFPIVAAASLTARHKFADPPRVTIVDEDGVLVETDVAYGPGVVYLTFAVPFTGTLYLSQ